MKQVIVIRDFLVEIKKEIEAEGLIATADEVIERLTNEINQND
jgi:hypothetical protein